MMYDKIFTEIKTIPKDEYENCTFSKCNLANADLSYISFTECVFEHCDLSMAKILNSSFSTVQFNHCKLLGLHFDDCDISLLSLDFEDCILNFSSFNKLKLKTVDSKSANFMKLICPEQT